MILDYGFYSSPIGLILLATENNKLCWLSLATEKNQPESELLQCLQKNDPRAALQHNTDPLRSYLDALEAYFQGIALPTDLPLQLEGTPWQQQVWQSLQGIHHGSTISYTELAVQCGKPQAARAAANACGQNNIALFVPCHRVVAKSGAIAGYKWGVENKNWLLNWEKA